MLLGSQAETSDAIGATQTIFHHCAIATVPAVHKEAAAVALFGSHAFVAEFA